MAYNPMNPYGLQSDLNPNGSYRPNGSGSNFTIQGGMQQGQTVPISNSHNDMWDWSEGYQSHAQDMVLGPDGKPQNLGGFVRDKWGRSYAADGGGQNTLGGFVSKMSGGGGAAGGADFAGQISMAQNAVNAQLAQPQPTMEMGNRYGSGLTASEGRLNRLMDNASELQASPAYNFRIKQGQQALERSLGAKGLLNSGNRLTALTNYGQEAGSQEYENEFNRRKGVFDAYANNYNTDRQGNITQFNAQSNAANNRLGTLSDLMSKGNSAYNQANQTAAIERVGWGEIWNKQNQKTASPWYQQTGARLT